MRFQPRFLRAEVLILVLHVLPVLYAMLFFSTRQAREFSGEASWIEMSTAFYWLGSALLSLCYFIRQKALRYFAFFLLFILFSLEELSYLGLLENLQLSAMFGTDKSIDALHDLIFFAPAGFPYLLPFLYALCSVGFLLLFFFCGEELVQQIFWGVLALLMFAQFIDFFDSKTVINMLLEELIEMIAALWMLLALFRKVCLNENRFSR